MIEAPQRKGTTCKSIRRLGQALGSLLDEGFIYSRL